MERPQRPQVPGRSECGIFCDSSRKSSRDHLPALGMSIRSRANCTPTSRSSVGKGCSSIHVWPLQLTGGNKRDRYRVLLEKRQSHSERAKWNISQGGKKELVWIL